LAHADVVVVENVPPGWRPRTSERQLGEVTSRMRVERIDDRVVHGEVAYEARGRRWTHAFAMRVFADEGELDAALPEVDLRLERWLDPERGWFVAMPRQAA
jgi:hypothetical protein